MVKNDCFGYGFNDPDLGCTCPDMDRWYVCPLEPEPKPEDFVTEEDIQEYRAREAIKSEKMY